MITQNHVFYSNGYPLEAILCLPDDYQEGERRPCIVPNSGYMGLNVIYPALFARAMMARGYAAFGFDCRGFLDNGGPVGVCELEEQVEDIRNALAYAQTLPEVDTERIGLFGWGITAALVITAAFKESCVRAIVGLSGSYYGERWLRPVYPHVDFNKPRQEVAQGWTRFVKEGTWRFDNPFRYYSLDPDTDGIVKDNLYTIKGYGQEISLELGQSLLEFNAEDHLDTLNVPVLVGHGKDNQLHPLEESLQFYDRISGKKELLVLDGKHNDFMFDQHPVFEKLGDALVSFSCEAMS